MAHARRQVLQAIVTALTGATAAATNVSDTRIYIIDPPAAGAIFVTFSSDAVLDEFGQMGVPSVDTHELTVEIQIHARDVGTVDTTLDALSAEVEVVLGADCTLGGLCEKFRLVSASPAFDGDGDAPHGVLTLQYSAEYRIAANAPETIVT